MGVGMTPSEEKLFNEKFKGVETSLQNLEKSIATFIHTQEGIRKDQQADICAVTATANENKLNLVKLTGRVETMEKVQKAKDDITGESKTGNYKTWQIIFVVIGIIASLVIGILNLVLK